MSLRKRVIACLDVTDGRVVKGTRFVDLTDAGDAVELAARYAAGGADEIVILDVGASRDRRPALLDLISRAAAVLDVPLAVGGGVRSVDDAVAILDAGSDKVSVNSGALWDPSLVDRLANRFGSQSVVISIDAARRVGGDGWTVRGVSGTRETDRDPVAWAMEATDRGAGEVLLTSIDRDGTRAGYDVLLTRAVSDAVSVPVVASGGAGDVEDIVAVLTDGGASASLLASMLHLGQVSIQELKVALSDRGVSVRPVPSPVSPKEVAAWLG
ncbi:MAG TPA: imidazole glycerol phosphate synthase subunit HisF [Candidatus Limnocylindria bacterium]|nr:imidazole glycerol phosphate synthase subunit HisF [Candidatus Limnocylindria bacterium]